MIVMPGAPFLAFFARSGAFRAGGPAFKLQKPPQIRAPPPWESCNAKDGHPAQKIAGQCDTLDY